MILDYDAHDNILGVEMLCISKRASHSLDQAAKLCPLEGFPRLSSTAPSQSPPAERLRAKPQARRPRRA
ncbi:hypothetical protein [Methylomagnum sp.]